MLSYTNLLRDVEPGAMPVPLLRLYVGKLVAKPQCIGIAKRRKTVHVARGIVKVQNNAFIFDYID